MTDETFHLTPHDVRAQEFQRSLRGFDPMQVELQGGWPRSWIACFASARRSTSGSRTRSSSPPFRSGAR
jgi:DivIVA domain-containing protein